MWSKFENGPIGRKARERANMNNCAYHNWGHVLTMYQFLEDEGAPYDPDLDAAIAFHDAVYDPAPKKEDRSARFLDVVSRGMPEEFADVDVERSKQLIYETIEHGIGTKSSESARWIIRADLHQLTIGQAAYVNFGNILAESLFLYECSVEEFAQSNLDFMNGLRIRVARNQHFDTDYANFWHDVNCGIGETMALSNMMLRKRS
jgi:hypothetical protein